MHPPPNSARGLGLQRVYRAVDRSDERVIELRLIVGPWTEDANQMSWIPQHDLFDGLPFMLSGLKPVGNTANCRLL